MLIKSLLLDGEFFYHPGEGNVFRLIRGICCINYGTRRYAKRKVHGTNIHYAADR